MKTKIKCVKFSQIQNKNDEFLMKFYKSLEGNGYSFHKNNFFSLNTLYR